MVTDSDIDIHSSDGGSFRGHVCVPAAGSGPGLVLLHEIFGLNDTMRTLAADYAAEGYLCIVPDLYWRIAPGTDLGYSAEEVAQATALRSRFDVERALTDIADTLASLRRHPAHRGRAGAVGYSLGGLLATMASARLDLDCAVAYYAVGLEQRLADVVQARCPLLLHVGSDDLKVPTAALDAIRAHVPARARLHVYPGCGHGFANPARETHDKPAAMMAHSRTIALLREVMGPVYDLSHLWEKHTEYEFAVRDVDATMATMVAEPYVNHVPTMTGGVGHAHLKRFYRHHFVNSNPPDTRLIPVSRTVGADRLVDEMVFCFTHTCEIPWMLPGLAPTGRYVEIPLVAIVNFRGDKLYHEHIYWDQASVLVQIGKLDPVGLPVAGIATTRKLLNPELPSNELMAAWAASADEPA